MMLHLKPSRSLEGSPGGLCGKVVRGVRPGQGSGSHLAPLSSGSEQRTQGSEVQREECKIDTGEDFLAMRDLVIRTVYLMRCNLVLLK